LQNFVFANMPPSGLKTMIRAFEKVSFEKNAKIITQGDTGDYFYVIKVGQVGLPRQRQTSGRTRRSRSNLWGTLPSLFGAPCCDVHRHRHRQQCTVPRRSDHIPVHFAHANSMRPTRSNENCCRMLAF
jgi:hypothetical protein